MNIRDQNCAPSLPRQWCWPGSDEYGVDLIGMDEVDHFCTVIRHDDVTHTKLRGPSCHLESLKALPGMLDAAWLGSTHAS